jgi:hypothetical protein
MSPCYLLVANALVLELNPTTKQRNANWLGNALDELWDSRFQW